MSGVASFFTIYEIHQTGQIRFSIDGVINDIVTVIKCSLNTLDISSGVE